MNSTRILQEGQAALAQAVLDLSMQVSSRAIYWLLGQAYAESGLGAEDLGGGFSQFKGTNNWGAVYWFGNPPKSPNPFSTRFTDGRDTNPGGVPFKSKISVYDSQLDGAKGFLSVFRAYGADALGPLATGETPLDMARGLYKHGYFTGCHVGLDGAPSLLKGHVLLAEALALKAKVDANPTIMISCAGRRSGASMLHATQFAADEANIAEYAQMISNGAAAARKANSAPPEPKLVLPPGEPAAVPFVPGGIEDGFPWASALILGAVGIGGTVLLAHKDPHGLAGRVVGHVTDAAHSTLRFAHLTR
jgi:hypothetical protein